MDGWRGRVERALRDGSRSPLSVLEAAGVAGANREALAVALERHAAEGEGWEQVIRSAMVAISRDSNIIKPAAVFAVRLGESLGVDLSAAGNKARKQAGKLDALRATARRISARNQP